MKVLLDANVLFPTLLREILLATARRGAFRPLWSDRILEEWGRATVRLGEGAEAIARGEIARLKADWPEACVTPKAGDLARLWLPDPADIHILAAAIAGGADVIVTRNARDFPRTILAEEGLSRADPDRFLLGLWKADPAPVAAAVAEAAAEASRLAGTPLGTRALLKRAGLPRLGKALA